MVVKDSGKPIGSEEFFKDGEALGITIDRRPKKRPKKKVDKWVSVPIILLERSQRAGQTEVFLFT